MSGGATICIPIRGSQPTEILLGFKKVGFAAGKYNGIGGKVEAGESITEAAVRELEEETGLRVAETDLQAVGHFTFLFPAKPEWNQVVHAFLVRSWRGDARESREIAPAWFAVDEIPFHQMWQDDPHWLPRVLAGERLRAHFTFQEDNETIDELQIDLWNGYS